MNEIELLLSIKQDIVSLKNEIVELKKEISAQQAPRYSALENWIPRIKVMNWIDYGDTQMGEFIKIDELITTQIGKENLLKYFS